LKITFDPTKRAETLAELGLDFADAALVFAGVTLDAEDDRARPWRGADGHRRPSGRPDGDRGVDAARTGAAGDFDEEGQ